MHVSTNLNHANTVPLFWHTAPVVSFAIALKIEWVSLGFLGLKQAFDYLIHHVESRSGVVPSYSDSEVVATTVQN